jgi:hypothetical protein
MKQGEVLMPRRKNAGGVTSAFRQVQEQARSLMVGLRKEIEGKEVELKRLKQEEASLSHLVGRAADANASSNGGGGSGGRINWRSILEQLPKQFSAAQIRSVRGLKSKRPSEIFAAITRWIEAGTVKRKSRGVYERA